MSATPEPLKQEHRRTLQAVARRILPGVHGPGATRTAAAVGAEAAIVHPCMRGLRPGVEGLLGRLQTQAGQLYAKEFASCTTDEQDELLRGLEQDPNRWTRLVWRFLIGFCIEGLLGDPVHGGNRGFLGWEGVELKAADVRAGLCRTPREA